MPQIETGLGPIDANQREFTFRYEQVLIAMGEDNRHYPWMFDRDATRANVVRELSEARAGGVDSRRVEHAGPSSRLPAPCFD